MKKYPKSETFNVIITFAGKEGSVPSVSKGYGLLYPTEAAGERICQR